MASFLRTTTSWAVALQMTLIGGDVRAASQAAALVGPSAPPPAEGKAEIDDLTQQAIEAFEAKRYDEAVSLFEEAYALDRKPNLLFNIGRVYEEAGDLEGAAEFYRRFIKQPSVTLESRKLALERLRVVEELIEATKPPDAPQPVVSQTPELEGDAEAPPPRPPAPPMRRAGFSLLGIGAASLAVGAGLGGAALVQKQRLDEAQAQPDRHEAAVQGRTFALASDILLGVGAAIAVTGIVLTALSYRRSRPNAAQNRVRWHGGGLVVDF